MKRISTLLALLPLIGVAACTEERSTGVGDTALVEAEADRVGVAGGPGGSPS